MNFVLMRQNELEEKSETFTYPFEILHNDESSDENISNWEEWYKN